MYKKTNQDNINKTNKKKALANALKKNLLRRKSCGKDSLKTSSKN
jgi:hypothetical protein